MRTGDGGNVCFRAGPALLVSCSVLSAQKDYIVTIWLLVNIYEQADNFYGGPLLCTLNRDRIGRMALSGLDPAGNLAVRG
jgi:hypothetical protein